MSYIWWIVPCNTNMFYMDASVKNTSMRTLHVALKYGITPNSVSFSTYLYTSVFLHWRCTSEYDYRNEIGNTK